MNNHKHVHYSFRDHRYGMRSLVYYPTVAAARKAVDKLGGGDVFRQDGTVVASDEEE